MKALPDSKVYDISFNNESLSSLKQELRNKS